MEVNINDYVTVELTDAGYSLLTSTGFVPEMTSTHVWRARLWEVMMVFGQFLQMNGYDYLKNNRIVFEERPKGTATVLGFRKREKRSGRRIRGLSKGVTKDL